MTTVFHPSTRCQDTNTRQVSTHHINTHHSRAAVCPQTSSGSQDSLRKPASILLGAAALVILLVPTGTFKLSEAAPLAAIAAGGAVACLAADKHNTEH